MKPVVAVTGGRGLVGSRFIADFSESFVFKHLDVSDPVSPVDITDFDQVMQALKNEPITAIVHFAAYTDVTGAWNQRGDKAGVAYTVNVKGTEVMARAANELSAQLVHISTAYVFDGKKEEPYTEDDPINPIEWYGQTKAWAEEQVEKIADKWTILRIDQPFRPDVFPKADIVHRILKGLRDGTLYPQFSDHFFGPTFIPDFAKILNWTIQTHSTGLFHASSGEQWSDLNFAQAVARANDLDENIVTAGSLENYLKTMERPYQKNTALKTDKLIRESNLSFKSIRDSLHVDAK